MTRVLRDLDGLFPNPINFLLAMCSQNVAWFPRYAICPTYEIPSKPIMSVRLNLCRTRPLHVKVLTSMRKRVK